MHQHFIFIYSISPGLTDVPGCTVHGDLLPWRGARERASHHVDGTSCTCVVTTDHHLLPCLQGGRTYAMQCACKHVFLCAGTAPSLFFHNRSINEWFLGKMARFIFCDFAFSALKSILVMFTLKKWSWCRTHACRSSFAERLDLDSCDCFLVTSFALIQCMGTQSVHERPSFCGFISKF